MNVQPLSIEQQAHLVNDIAWRCRNVDGSTAGETFISIDKETAERLVELAQRLFRMAPYEADIRRVVTGRG